MDKINTKCLRMSFYSDRKPSMKTWQIGFYSFFLRTLCLKNPESSRFVHDENSPGISFSEPVFKNNYFSFNVSANAEVISDFLHSFISNRCLKMDIDTNSYQCFSTSIDDVNIYSGTVIMQTGISIGSYSYEDIVNMTTKKMSAILKHVTMSRFKSFNPGVSLAPSVDIAFDHNYIEMKKSAGDLSYIHNVSIKDGGSSSIRAPIILSGKGKTAYLFFELCHTYGVGCRTNLGLGCTYPNRPARSV